MPIQVLAVDDHDVVLSGLEVLLEKNDMRLQATAQSAAEAMKKLGKRKPDVVLTGVRLPDGDGIGLVKQIKTKLPALPVVFFSGYDSPIYLARAYAAGAAGYVLKHDRSSRLIDVVRRAAGGKTAWTTEQLKWVSGGVPFDPDRPLTSRESEVLQLVSHGLTNKEIAAVLQISYETVKEHVQHILRKLGVRHRTQAAVWAVRKEMPRSGKVTGKAV